jgi:cell division protein FtsB
VAGALAQREAETLTGRPRRPRSLAAAPNDDARRQPRTVVRSRLGTRLIAFGVCLALLAVGRVTLSFAVVQKNLQTNAVVRQQRALVDENSSLSEELARLASTLRVQRLATSRYGLVPADDVRYLVPRSASRRVQSAGGP